MLSRPNNENLTQQKNSRYTVFQSQWSSWQRFRPCSTDTLYLMRHKERVQSLAITLNQPSGITEGHVRHTVRSG